jgi:hypothetical protein
MPLSAGRDADDVGPCAGSGGWPVLREASLTGAGVGTALDAGAATASGGAEPSAMPGGLTTSVGKGPIHAVPMSALPLTGSNADSGGEGGAEGAGRPIALGAS